MEQNQKPIVKFSAGAVSSGIWENQININGQTKPILKAMVSRRYRDRNDIWKTTYSFSRNEIPLAIYCLEKAFERMLEKSPEHQINGAIEEERVM